MKDELQLRLVPSAERTGVVTWSWPQQVMEKGLGASQSAQKEPVFGRTQELELTSGPTAASASSGSLTSRPVTAVKTINSQITPFLLRAASNWRKKKQLPLSLDEKFSHLPLHC